MIPSSARSPEKKDFGKLELNILDAGYTTTDQCNLETSPKESPALAMADRIENLNSGIQANFLSRINFNENRQTMQNM